MLYKNILLIMTLLDMLLLMQNLGKSMQISVNVYLGMHCKCNAFRLYFGSV